MEEIKDRSFDDKVVQMHTYLDENIVRNDDIYSVVNTTLTLNPNTSNFPEEFLFKRYRKENKLKLFIFNIAKFYALSMCRVLSFVQTLLYYRVLYSKPRNNIDESTVNLDVFFLVDKIVKEGEFHENYFSSLYKTLEKKNVDFVFIPRLFGLSLNPIKTHRQLKSFFNVINNSNYDFLFEHDFFKFRDLISLNWMITCYPFKTLRFKVKERNLEDRIFNKNLLKDIGSQSIVPFTRYIFGKHVSKLKNLNKIYSWSEFQSLERSFNYAIRKNGATKVYACQFNARSSVYFSSYIRDRDELAGYAPHRVYVNGKNYLLEENSVDYRLGVSLRYRNIFYYDLKKNSNSSKALLLGSFSHSKNKLILNWARDMRDLTFKGHPSSCTESLENYMPKKCNIVNGNIYDLFPKVGVVIGVASGSLLEAVACGISVIVLGKKDELIFNPLVDFGKGRIWDIAFSKVELESKYRELLSYRMENQDELHAIANWYRDNFFIEPTEEAITRIFEIN